MKEGVALRFFTGVRPEETCYFRLSDFFEGVEAGTARSGVEVCFTFGNCDKMHARWVVNGGSLLDSHCVFVK
jgi:hypothetical protein